ncbi:MAG: Ig-like domain-containing protein [Candidatus Berkelbacteria bacterium]|nr:Ig-like domain-containing protein [Candidatus Berkelbacteria bacterium]
MPTGPSYAWSKVSGPGTITFGTPATEDTNISADTYGVYILRLTVTDNAGNPTSDDINFTWDNTAPAATVNAVASPSNNTTPTITGTATDAYSNVAGVDYRIDGGTWNPAAASDGTFNSSSEGYTLTTAALGDGSRTIEIRATDSLGNVTTSSFPSRTFVVDTAPPVVSITAPLATNRVKGSVVVVFTDGELTSAQCSIDNSNWVACVSGVTTLSGITGFDALGEGNFTLYLRDTDLASNTGTDSEINVVKDTAAPTFTVGTPTSTNSNPSRAKVGDTVSISFTSSEVLAADPTVTFGGQSMSKFSQTSNDYEYRRVLSGTETEGTAVASISGTDIAGNTGTDGSQSFTTDFTAPVTSDNASTAWTKNDVTVTLSAVETGSTPATTLYSTDDSTPSIPYITPFTLSTEGTYQLKYASADAAGNIESGKTGTLVRIDKSAPTTSATITNGATANGAGWFKDAPQVALSTISDASGVADTYYHFNSDSDSAYTTAVTMPEGTTVLHFHSVDNAGNIESDQTITYKVDTHAPSTPSSITVDSGATITSDKQLSATWSASTDTTGGASGVDHYLLRVRTGTSGSTLAIPEITLGNVTTYTLSPTEAAGLTDGVYTVGVRAVDTAGNVGSTRYQTAGITIDTTAPTGTSININSGAAYATSAAVSLGLAATDAFTPVQMKVSNNADLSADGVNGDSGTWIALSATKAWTLSVGEGTKTVYAAFKDAGNNTSATISDSITLDSIAPAAPTIIPISTVQHNSVSLSGTAEANSTVNLTLTNGATVTDTASANGSGNWSKTVNITSLNDGTVTVSATATDAAGNTGSAASTTFSKDATEPTFASITANPANAAAGSTVSITFTASETLQANPTVTVGGASAAYVSNSGLNYTYTYAVGGADTEGTKTISVSGTDLSENLGTSTGSVIFDFTGPTASNPLPGDTTNHRPTASVVLNDSISGVNVSSVVIRINGIAVTTSYDAGTGTFSYAPNRDLGNRTYNVTVDGRDNAGNAMTRNSFSFTVSS